MKPNSVAFQLSFRIQSEPNDCSLKKTNQNHYDLMKTNKLAERGGSELRLLTAGWRVKPLDC